MTRTNNLPVSEACRVAYVHFDSGRHRQASSICRKILDVNPNHEKSLHLLVKIAIATGNYREMLTHYALATSGQPENPKLLYYHGLALEKLGDRKQAIPRYREALKQVDGDNKLESIVRSSLARNLQDKGQEKEALQLHNRALELNPDNHYARMHRASILLARGDMEQGWKDFESRLFIEKPGSEVKAIYGNHPRWQGEDFQGKTLLVREDFGIGDLLQFLRFLPLVKQRGGKVVLAVRKKLLGLLADASGTDEVISRELAQQRSDEYDLQVTMMSLPFLLDIRLDKLPVPIPYLHADPTRSEAWRKRLGQNSFRVGLVWTANPENMALAARSIALKDLAPWLDVPGITLYGLQYGETAAEADCLTGNLSVLNIGDEVVDFEETAAVVANMDLVITVDTAMAHLAGAMDIPDWVLLPYPAEWRWMRNREDSPWYPAMRLFRQEQAGEWEPVFNRVRDELQELVESG